MLPASPTIWHSPIAIRAIVIYNPPTHIQQLQHALQQRWGGQTSDYQITGPLQERLYSHIYKVVGARLPHSLAAKFCLHAETGQPDDAIAREQFHALQKVMQTLQTPGFNISQPIALFEKMGLLLMEWVDAPTLTQSIRWNTPAKTQCQALERAGLWLAHFHQAGPFTTSVFDWQDKQKEAREMARNLLDDIVFEKAAHTLLVTAVRLSKLQVQCSWVHGDSKTDNLLISADCITGIDVGLRDFNPVEYDVSQFLNHLALLTHAPQRLLWLRALWPGQIKLEEFEQAFLRGYRKQQPQLNDFALTWLRLFQLLSLWHSTCASTSRSLRHRVLNYLFRNSAETLQTQLKRLHHGKA